MQDAAIGIVLSEQQVGKVLWVKRNDMPIWVLPGGGIDPGESPEEAVLREVFEESGLKVRIEKKSAHYLPINSWTKDTHVYVCSVDSVSFRLSDEVSEMCFCAIDSPPFPHFPLHLDWLKEAFQPNVSIMRPMSGFSWGRVGFFFLSHPLILLRYLFGRLFS